MYDQDELLDNLLNTLSNISIDYEEMSGKTLGLELIIDKEVYLYDGEKITKVRK